MGGPAITRLLAVLGEAHFLLHGWLRSGNCGTARGAEEFLKEALALWGQRQKIRLLRADSGFFEDKLLSFLEQRSLPYIVVARMTKWVKRASATSGVWTHWTTTTRSASSVSSCYGWDAERRFVVIRELVRESRASVGRKLIDVPGYTFRVFVTSRDDAPEEIWRDYNRRADMENRIAELKHDLGAHGFCMKQFFATEAAFRSVLLLFNLLSEFQRAAGLPRLSRARYAPHPGAHLRSHPGPRRPPHGCPPVPKLGWIENEDPLAGQHLGVGISNFAEVGCCCCHLNHQSAAQLDRKEDSLVNFVIQVKIG